MSASVPIDAAMIAQFTVDLAVMAAVMGLHFVGKAVDLLPAGVMILFWRSELATCRRRNGRDCNFMSEICKCKMLTTVT